MKFSVREWFGWCILGSNSYGDDNAAQMASDQIERVYSQKMNEKFQKPVARLQLT